MVERDHKISFIIKALRPISSLVGYLSCWSYPVPSVRTAAVLVFCDALKSKCSI